MCPRSRPLDILRQAVATLDAVNDVGNGGVEIRAFLDDLHVGLQLLESRVQRALSSVEDQVPAVIVELEMLEEELKHGIVAASPNQINTARLLLSTDDRQGGCDTNATGYQDLIVVAASIVVRTASQPARAVGIS